MDIRQTNCPSRHKGALGGFRGQTFKSLEKLSNGWTDWHQLWFTSANSFGNGHWLNPSRPSIAQGALGGGVGGHNFKSMGEVVKRLHRLAPNLVHVGGFVWEWTSRLNTIRPTIPQGHFGFLGGHKFKCLGKLSNGWSDWHRIWYKSADWSGNGHRLNTIRPSISQGEFCGFLGSQIQKSVEAVKRLDRLAPNLAHMCRFIWESIRQTNCPLRHKGALGGFRVSQI